MTDAIQFPSIKNRQVHRFAKIRSSAVYYPPCVMSNDQIIEAYSLPVTDTVVRKKLGVRHRHVADDGTVDSDLLTNAARACLEQAGVGPDSVSRILVTKFLGDNLLPMTAAMVQRKLGCRVANQCYDVDGGANSFFQALDIAATYIATGDELVLLASGGIMHGFVNRSDPRLSLLFGDGAASVLLSAARTQHILSSFHFSNHEYVDLFTGFDTSWPLPDDAFNGRSNRHFYDLYHQGDWRTAISYYVEAARATLRNLCSGASVDKNEIKHVLITEQNRELTEKLLNALDIPLEKSISILGDRGNLMSASLPALFDDLFKRRTTKPGDLILALSFGEGISGGGIIYKV
jgi:3-oxoacyl-[acyl-carrier-protein] synthase III